GVAGQLDPLPLRALPVVRAGDLHVDADELAVVALELGQLGDRELTEPIADRGVAPCDGDVHHQPAPSPIDGGVQRLCSAPVRPTWSPSPHPPAEGSAAHSPLRPCSAGRGRLGLREGRTYLSAAP